jgi:hypothetical protein
MENNEFVLPNNVPDLWDLTAELWDKIADETDKKVRKQLTEQYNEAAKKANELAGRDAIILITPKVKVIKSKEEEPLAELPVKKAIHIPQGMTGETLTKKVEDSKKTKVVTTVKVKENTKTQAKGEPKTGSIIQQIIEHHKKGLSNKEIVELGFNKSTVNRQVSEYKKRKADGKE